MELLDGDGISLMKELSLDPQLKSLPFVFLLPKKPASALEKRLLEGGASNILSNASKPDDLLAVIGKLIEKDNLPVERSDDETTE